MISSSQQGSLSVRPSHSSSSPDIGDESDTQRKCRCWGSVLFPIVHNMWLEIGCWPRAGGLRPREPDIKEARAALHDAEALIRYFTQSKTEAGGKSLAFLGPFVLMFIAGSAYTSEELVVPSQTALATQFSTSWAWPESTILCCLIPRPATVCVIMPHRMRKSPATHIAIIAVCFLPP